MHTKKAYGGVEVQLHSFLALTPDGVSGQLQSLAPLPLGRGSPVRTKQKVWWDPEQVHMFLKR